MITVRELPDQTGKPFPRSLLLCEDCGAEYSAHRGDYFLLSGETVCTCGNCGAPLLLVVKTVRYRRARQ